MLNNPRSPLVNIIMFNIYICTNIYFGTRRACLCGSPNRIARRTRKGTGRYN